MEIFEDLNKKFNLKYKSNNDIDWYDITLYRTLDKDFIDKYYNKINWETCG